MGFGYYCSDSEKGIYGRRMVILDKIGRRQAKEISIEVAVEEVELMRQCDGLSLHQILSNNRQVCN